MLPLRERARPQVKVRVAPAQAVERRPRADLESFLGHRRAPACFEREDLGDAAVRHLKGLVAVPEGCALLRGFVGQRILVREARVVDVAGAACMRAHHWRTGEAPGPWTQVSVMPLLREKVTHSVQTVRAYAEHCCRTGRRSSDRRLNRSCMVCRATDNWQATASACRCASA